MLTKDFNPFGRERIHLPEEYWEKVQRYSRTFSGGDPRKSDVAEVPFNRYLDVWFVSAALGARREQYVELGADRKHYFARGGEVLQGDLPRIEFIMLLAIAHTGDAYVVNDPRRMMDVAEGYAAGGMPYLFEMIEKEAGGLSAVENVTRDLVRELTPAQADDQKMPST